MTETEIIKCLFDWPDPDNKARRLVEELHEHSRELVRKGISAPIRVEKKGIVVTGVSGTGGVRDLKVQYRILPLSK
jgi:hypothetical protein